jgi:amidase
MLSEAVETLRRHGAAVVDPAEIPTHARLGETEFEILLYEFKAGLNAYLESRGPSAPVHSLKEVIDFNERNRERELAYFGQETLLRAQEMGPLTERAYREAVDKARRLSRDEGLDAILDRERLDALVAPTTGPAGKTDLVHGDRGVGGSSGPAAISGYPSITLPGGEAFGLPMGISFVGRAWSEPGLLRLAYGFEQATRARRTPSFRPTVG